MAITTPLRICLTSGVPEVAAAGMVSGDDTGRPAPTAGNGPDGTPDPPVEEDGVVGGMEAVVDGVVGARPARW